MTAFRFLLLAVFTLLLPAALATASPAPADDVPRAGAGEQSQTDVDAGDAANTAETTPKPKAALRQRVIDAYEKVDSYRARVTCRTETKMGRRTGTESFWYRVAWDRDRNALMIDHENFRLVSDGKHLRLRVLEPGLDDRYLEAPAPRKLERVVELVSGSVGQVFEVFGVRVLPDLAMIMADKPFTMLAPGKVTETQITDDAGKKQRVLQMDHPEGRLTLYVDPRTHYIDAARIEADAQQLGLGADDHYRIIYEIQREKVNEKLAADTFDFDTAGRGFGSLDAMVNAGPGGGSTPPQPDPNSQQQPDPNARAQGHPMEGRDAPAINLPDTQGNAVDLAKTGKPVVVVSFWFSWLSSGAESLKVTEQVAAWASAQKLDVAFAAINCGESAKDVNAYIEKNKVTVPVLIDEKSSVAMNGFGLMNPTAIVVLKDGKVHRMFTQGFTAEAVQAAVTEALVAPDGKQPDEPAAPDAPETPTAPSN